MGEQMKTVREMLEKDDELQEILQKTAMDLILISGINLSEVMEDPAQNATVARILRHVGQRIVKSENENLRMHFRMLCQMTGISLDWDKSEGEDVIIDLGSVSGDFAAIGGSRTTGRIPIARMTGRIVLDDIPGLGGEIREIKIDQSRMKLIKRGDITVEICVDEEGSRKYKEGDEVLLSREEEGVRVRMKRVAEYNSLLDLVDGEHDKLGKWLGTDPRDAIPVVRRIYGGTAFEGKKLVVYEFAKTNE